MSDVGRPKERPEERLSTSVRLTPTLRDRLTRECNRRLVGRNRVIERAIEEWLDRNEGGRDE